VIIHNWMRIERKKGTDHPAALSECSMCYNECIMQRQFHCYMKGHHMTVLTELLIVSDILTRFTIDDHTIDTTNVMFVVSILFSSSLSQPFQYKYGQLADMLIQSI
jgi:hypothetical protein